MSTQPLLDKLTILEAIPDIVAVVNNAKVYTWINKPGLDFFGNDTIGKPASYYFEGQQDTYDLVKPLFSGSKETVYLESWQRRVDDQKRLLAWWCHTLKDENGNIIGTISTARDITDQKTTEKSLRESEERLKKAQSVAHVGNWELDLTTHQIWASEEAFRIYGFERQTPFLTLQKVQKSVLPEYRQTLDKALSDIINYEIPYNQEFQIKRENDESVRFIRSVAELQKNTSGKPAKVSGTIQDITDQKNTGKSLKESQMVLQNIINLLPIRIFWKDINLTYLGCNLAFAKDAGKNSPDELIGKDDFQMTWKDQADLYREDDMKIIKTGQSKLDYEEPQTTPNGNTIWLNTNKVPLFDANDKVIGVLGTYLDITERKQAEIELKRKNKDLEIMNVSMVERESKMIDLKRQIKELESKVLK